MGSEPIILLDTHVLVWLAEGNERLGKKARGKAEAAFRKERLCVSAISFWEVAMLHQKGRLDLHRSLDMWRTSVLNQGIREIAITGSVGIRAASLESFHSDPADRLIVATAQAEGAILLTADERILGWDGPVRSGDARE